MPQVSLDEFVEGIVSGRRLGSFLTDTVPALAAKPDRADLIFRAKQRSLDKPLILMAAAIDDLWPYVAGSLAERQIWRQMAECYWPGALTLVLPASSIVPSMLNPTDPSTIGVRVPNHAIAQAILQRTGPLATTSANRSGQPALQTLADIAAEFPDALTLAPSETIPLRFGQTASGQPSTVAKWTDQQWQILRQGAIKLTDMTGKGV
jgi:L-threonylcarbamoyladenylate synthase